MKYRSMMSMKALWKVVLLGGMVLLPLLLAGWTWTRPEGHLSGFYLLAFFAAAFGLTAGLLLIRTPSSTRGSRRHPAREASGPARSVEILVAVSLPSSGPELLRLAKTLAPAAELHVTALHLWPEHRFRIEAFEQQHAVEAPAHPLRPLLQAAGDLPVTPRCLVSRDVAHDMIEVAGERRADVVLMGWHRPVVPGEPLPEPVRSVLQEARAAVGIYLARQFRPWRRILVPYTGSLNDRAALEIAARMARNTEAHVTILHVIPPQRPHDAPRLGVQELTDQVETPHVRVKIVEQDDPVAAAIREAWIGYDLLVMGAAGGPNIEPALFADQHARLAFSTACSLLIVRGQQTPSGRERRERRQAWKEG